MEKDQEQTKFQGLERSDSGEKDKPFLTTGRLSVKLKMPRRDQFNGEGSIPMAEDAAATATATAAAAAGLSTNNQNRVCKECGKVFTSGKAFGGHKRIHVQAAKKSQKPNLVVNKNDQRLHLPHRQQLIVAGAKDRHNNVVEDEVSCAICGKGFISMKALFGHMRFHPDRGWRGIQPPSDVALKAASSTSTLSDDRHHMDSSATTGSVLDLKDSLRGWSVTAKRGRKSLLSTSSASGYGSGSGSDTMAEPNNDDDGDDLEDKNDMEEAVNDLLIFARGGSSESDESPKKKGAHEDQKSSSEAGNKSPETEKTLNKLHNKGKAKAIAETHDNNNNNHHHHRQYYPHEDNFMNNGEPNKTISRRKKKRRLCDLEREGESAIDQNNQAQHICITCNKPFPSHQALGGHRASHNKLKNVVAFNNAAKEPVLSGLDQEIVDCKPDSDHDHLEKKVVVAGDQEVSAGDHQCNICSKSFPTGQALGGHKRCHWTAAATAVQPETQGTSSSPEQQLQPTTRIIHSFDLNELPPQEDGDS